MMLVLFVVLVGISLVVLSTRSRRRAGDGSAGGDGVHPMVFGGDDSGSSDGSGSGWGVGGAGDCGPADGGSSGGADCGGGDGGGGN